MNSRAYLYTVLKETDHLVGGDTDQDLMDWTLIDSFYSFSSTATKRGGRGFNQQDINRVRDFFNRENIRKQLKTMISFLIPDRSNVELNLNIGGGSFTDGNSITVGLPEMFIKSSLEEIFIVLQALTGHEAQHINSSNFNGYVKYQRDIVDSFMKKYPKMNSQLLGGYMKNIAVAFGNGVEDGRIEKILGNKYPGFVDYLKFLNGSIWKAQEIKGDSELEDFLNSVIVYSVTGLYPKGFNKVYKGTELEKNLKKIKPMIVKGINAVSCDKCLSLCKEMISTVESYLVRLLEERTQFDEEFLKNLPSNPEFTTSSEKDFNTSPSISIHFKPENKKDDKKEDKKEDENEADKEAQKEKELPKDIKEGKKANQGAGSDETPDDESNMTEDQSSSSVKDSEEENSNGENESEKKKENDKGDSDEETNEDSEKDRVDSSKNAKESDRNLENEDDTSSDESDNISKENPERQSDTDSNMNMDSGQESDDEPDGQEPEVNDEKLVEKAIGDVFKDLESNVKGKIAEETIKSKKSKKDDDDSKLNKEEISEIKENYKGEYTKNFHEVRGFPLRYSLHENIKREGKKFRKEVEAIFRNKQALTLRGQKRGVIDASNLYKVGAKDYNVFLKRGVPDTSEYVAYLLWDGSGSMDSDNKQMHSGFAVAVAEEGLKGIIPFKAAQFSVDNRNWVTHYVVKNFNENGSTYNYTYNFLHHRKASGGNKDGYSIRVATAELMKRPEKDRILIIFSDGLPSDYTGGYKVGMNDVKEAVKEARAKGIFVVSLLFGTESFRDSNIEEYKSMYDKNIISCEPSQITGQMIRMLKKVISR
jgi:hypothetical protein